MDIAIRPLVLQDIDQVREIEWEAFSSTWPSTPFKRDLANRQLAYLVAWEPWKSEPVQFDSAAGETPVGKSSMPTRFVSNLRKIVGRSQQPVQASAQIIGFVGMWIIGPEAHITTIAVREAYRGQGIGELLLIGSVEVAMVRGLELISLEARASNHVAQSLYKKYGFVHMGVRKGYYTDNREDAVIMTTQNVNTLEYRTKYDQLRDAYRQRRGDISINLA